MDNPNLHTFDKDLEIVDKGSQVFALTLSDHWSINGTPNGGYLMGVIARIMECCSQKKATPIITANYISKCFPGKALAYVEESIQVPVIPDNALFDHIDLRLDLSCGRRRGIMGHQW